MSCASTKPVRPRLSAPAPHQRPGGSPAAAHLHLARTVVRRAERLITELGKLPGIGPRTAQRLAFHVLRSETQALAYTRRRQPLGTPADWSPEPGTAAEPS